MNFVTKLVPRTALWFMARIFRSVCSFFIASQRLLPSYFGTLKRTMALSKRRTTSENEMHLREQRFSLGRLWLNTWVTKFQFHQRGPGTFLVRIALALIRVPIKSLWSTSHVHAKGSPQKH